MQTILKTALALLFVGAASCVAYAGDAQPYPPASPPGYGAPPEAGYDESRSPDWEVGFFYQELSPFGDWIFTYEYGWTWLPRNVQPGWRPYYYGQWIPSDYGWYWASYEPFGWATYHFGRWAWHPRFGWIWTPGRTWGPAWVSWQYGQGYVGWAPLPPEVGFEIGIGLRLGAFDLRFGIQPHAYTFVEERAFLDRDIYRYAVPSARNVTIIQNTTNITVYNIVNNRVINRGVDLQNVERVTGRRVRQRRIAETQTEKGERVLGEEIVVYKPNKSRLDSVRVDENRTPRREPAAKADRPEAKREPEVAPRVKPEPPVRDERVERKEQKERQQLEAYERAERQRLEKVQKQEREKEKAQPPAKVEDVSKRQAAERQALEEDLKRAKQQLAARQEVGRKAAKATPSGKKKGDEKKAEPAKGADKGKKKGDDDPPPPFR